MKKTKPVPLHFDIRIGEPKPNKMFTQWQHAITKFLTYTKPVKCAYCGKSSKKHWTQLKFFKVADLKNTCTIKPSETTYPPLTPVCGDHLLCPED